jgi:AcrR family transcriptional regulator
MAESTTPQRVRLSRERILAAAIELADESGLEAVTMRRLAQRLGVEAMSLYHHVEHKDDLLDGLVDLVYAEIEVPLDLPDWQEAVRRQAHSARAALGRHRWAVALMASRLRPGPANLRHHNAVLGVLRRAGFPVDLAVHAFSLLDSFVYGFVLQEQALPFETPEELDRLGKQLLPSLPANTYPYMAETVAALTGAGYAFGDEFAGGLDLILEGLERRREDATRCLRLSRPARARARRS